MRHFGWTSRVLPTSILACGLFASPLASAETAKTESETTVTTKKHKAARTAKEVDVKHGDTPAVAADNTGTNKRDRDDRAVTADQQSNDKTDVQLAAEIRRAVMDDKTLSTSAHNIKIIVQDGKVTLKGPVASKSEKSAVERKAAEVVGQGKGRITSEVDVAP